MCPDLEVCTPLAFTPPFHLAELGTESSELKDDRNDSNPHSLGVSGASTILKVSLALTACQEVASIWENAWHVVDENSLMAG